MSKSSAPLACSQAAQQLNGLRFQTYKKKLKIRINSQRRKFMDASVVMSGFCLTHDFKMMRRADRADIFMHTITSGSADKL